MEMTRGDDREIVVEVAYTEDFPAVGIASGDPYPLTGATVWFTAESSVGAISKRSGSGIEISGSEAAENVATITIDAADTDALTGRTVYAWDIQIRSAGGKIWTVADGRLTVVPDVTRETI